MLKRELNINKRGLILWTSIIILIFLIVFLVYPSIATGENAKMINEYLKMFPEEMLKAFNMDISGIDSVFGWFKSEGYTLLLLIGGLYSSILGSTILLKEESDKTIEFLYSKPINKNQIIKSRILCGIINIAILVVVVFIFNLWGMHLSNDLDILPFTLLSLSPLLIFYVFFFISLFLSTFFTKTKKVLGISIGLVFISYFLQMMGNISHSVETLKFMSIFELQASRYIILNNNINVIGLIIGIILMVVLTFLTTKKYNKKSI